MKKRAVSLFMALVMAFTMVVGTISPAAAEEAGYTAFLASNAYNVSVNGTIQIQFSKAMDESASEPVTLVDAGGINKVTDDSFTWSEDGTRLDIALEGLEPFTEYTLALNEGLQAEDGSEADQEYSWTLLTAAAETVEQEHLVMHWEMDETSGMIGTYLYNDKTADSVAPVEDGKFNSALHFEKGTAVLGLTLTF